MNFVYLIVGFLSFLYNFALKVPKLLLLLACAYAVYRAGNFLGSLTIVQVECVPQKEQLAHQAWEEYRGRSATLAD